MKPKLLPPVKYLQEMFYLATDSPSGLRWRIGEFARLNQINSSQN